MIISALLLVTGLICVSSSDITATTQQTTDEPVLKQSYNWPDDTQNLEWYSDLFNLSQGDNVFVELYPPPVWGEPLYDPTFEYQLSGYSGPKFVYVDYVYNNTHETQFEVWYYQHIKTRRLAIGNRTICKNDCLIIENPNKCDKMGGTVKLAGSYRLRVSGPFPPTIIPPEEPQKSYNTTVMVLKKITSEKTNKPYGFLLPIGITTIFLGLISLIASKTYGKYVRKKRNYKRRMRL